MLRPNERWCWTKSDDHQFLSLDMGEEMLFVTPFKLRKLTNEVHQQPLFNAEDANYYSQLTEILAELSVWTEPSCVQIALNATAASRFHRPMMPQSFHFSSNSQLLKTVPMLVDLHAAEDWGTFFVIELTGQFAQLMCLSESLLVNESKTIKQFEVIKVSLDRLFVSHLLKREARKSA